ncbi:hypothetical protein Tco_0424964 [Tanacetum coccineum]
MDTAYGRKWIRRIGNCEYAFSCEDLVLICRISFPGYVVKEVTEVQTRGRESTVGMTWEEFKVLTTGHVAYTDRFNELARLVPYLVTLENKRNERYIYGLAPYICVMVATMEPTTIQSVVLKAGMLTDKAIRNGSLKKNT